MSETPAPFVIFALPRCRTFWCSQYLSYMSWYCGHEEAVRFRSLDDVKSWLSQPYVGSAETAAAPYWRLLKHYRPDTRVVVLRRPHEEIIASFAKAGWPAHVLANIRPKLVRLDNKLDQILQRWENCVYVTFDGLRDEATCKCLFEFCLPPYVHDSEWWRFMAPKNLQINLTAMVRYLQAHQPQLDKLSKTARYRMLSLMQPPPDSDDGVTFQVEPFDENKMEELGNLAQEHFVQTDQAPDEIQRKNLPLIFHLQKAGALQYLTARLNGRLFGYLLTVIAPSMDGPFLAAEHTAFFGSPLIKNIGMRLQRAALEVLRERGVDNVILRAGHRGSGPRLGTLYKRLGAEPFGEMWRYDLKEAA